MRSEAELSQLPSKCMIIKVVGITSEQLLIFYIYFSSHKTSIRTNKHLISQTKCHENLNTLTVYRGTFRANFGILTETFEI